MKKRRVRRRWMLLAGVILLGLLGALGQDSGKQEPGSERAAELGTPAPASTAPVTPTPTADPAKQARAAAEPFVRDGEYADAVAVYESAGLDEAADRVRRRGARALSRSARQALARGRYASAKRLATESRRLHRTTGARTVLTSANAQIAKAAAAKRERLRLARIARDARTCSSTEKRTVRDGGGVPAGCATYAAGIAERRAARAAEAQADACDPNYEGQCLDPGSSDYDCAGGSGDGPDYTGPVRVVGRDPHDLDRDGDGSACESS